MANLPLSDLLGAPVHDSTGAVCGRVREVALCPQENPARIGGLVVKTKSGDRLLAPERLFLLGAAAVRSLDVFADWSPMTSSEGMLLLERDLLDQQIIDVHGRKVVRVNDVDLQQEPRNDGASGLVVSVAEVEVGPRGAVRRLLKGLPRVAVESVVSKLQARVIPWDFVDLIEIDPARRVKLKISYDKLATLHPADLADILEELAPAQREAVFETLDEEVAAEALEEIDPRMQVSLLQSLDSDHAADIVEEMDPDAAADLLGELPQEASDEILEEMEPQEREEVSELLEFEEHSAAGRMTTDYIALPPSATMPDAVNALRSFEGAPEMVGTLFVVDAGGKLLGAVPLSALVMAGPGATVGSLVTDNVITCPAEASEKEFAELFDKYNLLLAPVVDEQGRLTGVITADDVISLLRKKL